MVSVSPMELARVLDAAFKLRTYLALGLEDGRSAFPDKTVGHGPIKRISLPQNVYQELRRLKGFGDQVKGNVHKLLDISQRL